MEGWIIRFKGSPHVNIFWRRKNGVVTGSSHGIGKAIALALAAEGAAHVNSRVFSVTGGYVGLFPEPDEEFLLYKDVITEGAWTIDDLADFLPAKLEGC